MNRKWNVVESAPPSFLETHPELSPLVAQLLYQRGIKTTEAVDEFLYPDYTKHIHDPFLFRDMEKALKRLWDAIEKQEKVTIHGDYDADGVSASTILTNTLSALGLKNLDVYLPHRELDGYGLNKKTVQLLKDQGTNIIITCDCGISNVEEVTLAQSLGMDVIITDHHTLPATLPPAFAIIHPEAPGETYPYKKLAGGGVAFKLAQALLKTHAKDHELLPNGERHEAFEKWLLDMVAIASVADMVPLIGESRTLTKYGLIVLNKTRRIGLKKLFLEARLAETDGVLKREITADTIGFQIAPRINAAGRLDHANVAYKLMVAEVGTDAVDLAFRLEENNNERRAMTDEFVEEAVKQVERDQKNNPVLFVIGDTWTTGIVGLIASRIKELYQKPTIAMAYNAGEITGSGRSIAGFNLVGALQTIPQHFKKFGGHPMACGFTLADKEKREAFQEALIGVYKEKTLGLDLIPTLDIDAEISLGDVTWELFDELEKFKPYGQANPAPKFLASGVRIFDVQAMGKDCKHLKLVLQHNTPTIRKAIGWNLCRGNKPDWSDELDIGDTIDLVFEINVNEWNGNRELQLQIVDLKRSE